MSKKARRAGRALFRLCVVDGVLNEERVRDVAQRIAASKRRGALATLACFARHVRLELDRGRALVESATPIGAPERGDIEAKIARLYGPRIDTSFAQNPDLIAGLRIKVGSDVYDGSVRARLSAIAAQL